MDKLMQAMLTAAIVGFGLVIGLGQPLPALADTDAEDMAEDFGRDMGGARACNIDQSRILDLEQYHIEEMRNTAEDSRDFFKAQEKYLEMIDKVERRGPREGCDAIRARLESPEMRQMRELGSRVESLEALSAQQLELLIKQQELLQQQADKLNQQ